MLSVVGSHFNIKHNGGRGRRKGRKRKKEKGKGKYYDHAWERDGIGLLGSYRRLPHEVVGEDTARNHCKLVIVRRDRQAVVLLAEGERFREVVHSSTKVDGS